MAPGAVALASPSPPGLQEATKNSTTAWQEDLESLFRHAKDRFPDVVWELTGEDTDDDQVVDEVWGHKAIVYARAPPSFQSRYFSFRPNPSSSSPLPYSSSPTGTYPATSAVSLGLPSAISRTPSPFRSGSPAPSTATAAPGGALLRIPTHINPILFSNELEYLYTGQGFGEAFEFLFDSSETLVDGGDAEELRIDKLRKDLVFMWRSRLYSDVRIALTGDFSSSSSGHEATTAIFSSHRFILVSRSPYFHTALLDWPSKPSPGNEPPTLTLPSPPFTPASLHFTLGFLYTGTLVFSHRTYDLSTAFAILRAAHYLALPTLHDEIQARIANEMMHGLFHAFLPFPEYERLTGGRWGTGGCRCRQCARRAPRVLEFSLSEDVKNANLERGARRALVGMFGEGWCTTEFAGLPQKIRDSLLKGVGKRTTPANALPLLFAAEHALMKLAPIIEPWADTVRDMILGARKGVEELLCKDAEACFADEEWGAIMEDDGVRFEDGERVEWVMGAILRGVKETTAAGVYQTLVSAILLRPHPTEPNAPLLSATSHIRVQVEQARLELLKWIGKRWIGIRQEKGFDPLEGWALKEISDHIEVSIEDLLNPAPVPPRGTSPRQKAIASSTLLRPMSNHPHTSRVDAESEAGSSMRDAGSMRMSVLSRNLPDRRGTTPTRLNSSSASLRSSASSVRSARSTVSTTSTASASTARGSAATGVSAARQLVDATRKAQQAKEEAAGKERPDSKLTPSTSSTRSRSTSPAQQPSIIEPDDDADDDAESSTRGDDGSEAGDQDNEISSPQTPPTKKTIITRPSLSSVVSRRTVASNTTSVRPKSSAASIRSQNTVRKPGTAHSTTRSLRPPPSGPSSTTTTPASSRPGSRGSTTSSRSPVTARSTISSRPISRVSTASTTSSISRPRSSVSTNTETTSTFRTAPTTRSRRTSTASSTSARTANAGSASNSPTAIRARRISGASVNSVASTTASVRSGESKAAAAKKAPPVPKIDAAKLSSATAGKMSRQTSSRSIASATSSTSATPSRKSAVVGTLKKKAENPQAVAEVVPPVEPSQGIEAEKENVADKVITEKESIPNSASTITIKPKTRTEALAGSNMAEHKKSSSTASTGSVATLKRKGSADTITKAKSANSIAGSSRAPPKTSKAQTLSSASEKPPPTLTNPAEYVPRGATLDIGIPCIISSKHKKFKAYARYIGEVEGESGPWVGVEVPVAFGDQDADAWEGRQWNDGSWGGIRYFEIGSGESEWDYGDGGDGRASRRRRVDGGSLTWGRDKSVLKRKGDQLNVSNDRMKRIRSASPAVSDASDSETRGLFVRPQQVLYVFDAVGSDL
ncbi:hypothetical protein BDQ12DRAFT_631641 [Crucibulum laeve]|uniref:BTB domain-containing protein n=1 Tax=Crucibulum laeve TaxID=68775 RepID=A0A5C3LXP7_9AGAR|nr:hypothetical protein BDQ12DRAFT_631641 [Crucibulum laeve]